MRRLIYRPEVRVWVKSDYGVVDLTRYITNCTVNRKVDQVSSATVTFRNPGVWDERAERLRKQFTEHPRGNGEFGPMFHPMDPIIIAMTRLRGVPIQVFTGYCDTTPYLSLYPGPVSIEASCTLKRLQYTYWDAGLPFTRNFLSSYGWTIDPARGGIVNPGAQTEDLERIDRFNDGSIANLLFAVLKHVGGWDEDTIYIEQLPQSVGHTVMKLYRDLEPFNEEAQGIFEDMLDRMVGSSSYGSGGGSDSGNGPTMGDNPNNIESIVKTVKSFCDTHHLPLEFVLTVLYIESDMGQNMVSPGNEAHQGWFQMQNQETNGGHPYAYGPGSRMVPTVEQTKNLTFALGLFCPAAEEWANRKPSFKQEANWMDWATNVQGAFTPDGASQFGPVWGSNLERAKAAARQYG